MDLSEEPKLRLYNTLTREKGPFVPLDPANVRMYVCGPTVYDYAHIGNARPVIVFDVLFRLLRHLYGESHVTYARNITDVDDKINARAARDFPGIDLNDAIRNVTEKTAAQFHADVAALGCLPPTDEPRATDHIGKMVDIVGRLLKNGCAYIAQGSEGREVLFEIARMNAYGVLSRRKLDEQIEGARVAVEAHKRHPGDFVLWKESGAGEPGWQAVFPTDQGSVTIFGRPGWHIECSAMSMARLLEPFGGGLACDDTSEEGLRKNIFDIHGGGLDLIFPHHENEIAQSCCAFGTEKMANVWMHNGFLQVEGQKMSKSLGNFITIHDLLHTTKFGGRSWPGEVLRLAMLKTHYRQPIDWTVRALEEAEKELKRLVHRVKGWRVSLAQPDDGVVRALSDDLNTHAALVKANELAKSVRGAWADPYDEEPQHGYLGFGQNQGGFLTDAEKEESRDAASRLVASMGLLGFNLMELVSSARMEASEVNSKQVSSLISSRNAARAAKDWPESDRIRAELDAMGIVVKDGKDEAGNPMSTWEVKR
jgi:cysteinyl-tRNA synthetase